MITETINQTDRRIYYRLIALWVICEAFAGGIMHGINLPFSGLIVSSLAVTCIILIGWHVPSGTAIIRATVIVAIFKLMLSPQSPPTAYIAVFFQGLTGQLFFLNKRLFKLSAILLSVLALVESAIQRLLVLVIIYGNGFWKAVNQFIQKLTGEKTMTNYTLVIAGIYIIIHAIVGIFIGIYSAGLAKKSETWNKKYPEFIIPVKKEAQVFEPHGNKKKKKIKLVFIVLWLALLTLLMQAYFDPGHSLVTLNEVTGLVIRSILIVLGWYLFIGPLIMVLIKKILISQQSKRKQDINLVLELLPQTKYIFTYGWQLSSKEKGYKRLGLFLKILMINILSEE